MGKPPDVTRSPEMPMNSRTSDRSAAVWQVAIRTANNVKLLALILGAVLAGPAAAQESDPDAVQLEAISPGAVQPGAIPPIDGAGASAFSVLSPYRTLPRSRQLLDTAVLRLVLELGYEEERAEERPRRTASLPGVASVRFLAKSVAVTGGAARVLELALAAYPEGGYRLYVYGTEVEGSEQRPNPDLAAAEDALAKVLMELMRDRVAVGPAKFGDRDNRFASYKLSYIQGDRAMALLKVLGYSVIEFEEAENQQTVYDKIFSVVRPLGSPPPDQLPLPVVIRMIDSEKTSILQPVPVTPGAPRPATPPRAATSGAGAQALKLGGKFLDRITTGVPQQRLLIAYDGNDPEPLQVLLNLLRDEIDVPAQQILIEALVIELDRDRLRELGVDFSGSKDSSSFSFETDQGGFALPFTYTFLEPSPKKLLELNVTLKALITRGDAEVLSQPSVLVLDGRQARIQVGEKIPFTSNISATNTGTLSSTDYLSTGIVLNLRPRISEDGSEITMQVETLISSAGTAGLLADTGVLVAPPIQSREVQTMVRVANNTPFIIGGLIATTRQDSVSGIPGLSKIPGLGALFRKKTKTDERREVIVVITPHVVPLEDRAFSYVIPKDSDIFNSFGKELFRNVYRLQAPDVFDLGFVYESQVFLDLVARARARVEAEPVLGTEEPYRSLLAGGVPGEEILVRRMLWEVVRRNGFDRHIDLRKTFFFRDTGDPEGLELTRLFPLLAERNKRDALVLDFDNSGATTVEHPFAPPRGRVGYERLTAERVIDRLRAGNTRGEDGTYARSTLLIADVYAGSEPLVDVLRAALALDRLLELNPDLPLTLKNFKAGTEIVFPNEADLRQRFHLVDREVAQLVYELVDYYLAFEKEFTLRHAEIVARLDGGG